MAFSGGFDQPTPIPGRQVSSSQSASAAIDLADGTGMDPENLVAHAIVLKFRAYVGLRYPSRADEGWRPLWHLSNDGLWTFYSNGRALTRSDFGPEGKPGTKSSLFPRFDRLALNGFLRGPWSQPTTRKQLRSYMIEILARDDVASRIFSRQLADSQVALDTDKWLVEDLSAILRRSSSTSSTWGLRREGRLVSRGQRRHRHSL
ncbi:hypothetical protein NKJ23_31250 [Mesorhizobium sp. M0184]|uniref:hypothetical protein n=1 Tax=Mesorhizobium sp. M0184 TaxID=2956906 RepID=UPI00333B77D3